MAVKLFLREQEKKHGKQRKVSAYERSKNRPDMLAKDKEEIKKEEPKQLLTEATGIEDKTEVE